MDSLSPRSVEARDLENEIGRLQAQLTELRRIRYGADRAERRKRIEQSPRVQSIKKMYLANAVSTEEIARAFNTSRGYIMRLVLKYDWPRRSSVKVKGQAIRRQRERAA